MDSKILKIYEDYYKSRGERYTPLQYAVKDILDIYLGHYTIERLGQDVNSWLDRTKGE